MVDNSQRRYRDELYSTMTLAGAGVGAAYFVFPSDMLESVRESVKMGRHAQRTVGEMVIGNEGQNAVNRVIEANLSSEEYYTKQLELINNLLRTYEINETLGREAERLGVQLKGMVAEATAAGVKSTDAVTFGLLRELDDSIMNDAGDAVTFGLLRELDDSIMNIASGKANEAREGLDKLQEMSRMARKFYDGREKLDKTIEGLMNHLDEVKLGAVRDNKGIEEDIKGMTAQLDKTYRVEDDTVFDIHKSVSFLETLMGRKYEGLAQRLELGKQEVNQYVGEVGELRTSVEQHAPIGPYENPSAWIDVGINPLSFGLVGALAVKGLTKLLPRFIEWPITKIFALPGYALEGAGKGTAYLAKHLRNKKKKALPQRINNGDNSNQNGA